MSQRKTTKTINVEIVCEIPHVGGGVTGMSHAEIRFNEVRIPEENLLGELNERVGPRPATARTGPADLLYALLGDGRTRSQHREGVRLRTRGVRRAAQRETGASLRDRRGGDKPARRPHNGAPRRPDQQCGHELHGRLRRYFGERGETIVDINRHGTYQCTQAAAARLKDGGGTVINLTSVTGQRGSPQMSHYGAAKAGVINLTTTLAYERTGDDVGVNCIAPGFVATPGVESQRSVSAETLDRSAVQRRIGLPEEIADIVQFLASPASSYIVGETITAQGVPRIKESPEI